MTSSIEMTEGKDSLHIPLSDTQRDIWIGQSIHPKSPLYNMAIACTIRGELDESRFIAAWQQVSQQHEILHTRICLKAGEPYQFFCSDNIPLNIIDFSTSSIPDSDAIEWMNQRTRIFMPVDASMVDACLIKLSARVWIWYCNQHHIITDATSFSVLWHQLCSAYENNGTNYSDNTDNRQSSKRTNYIDYINSSQQKPLPENLQNYWESQSKMLPPPLKLYGKPFDFSNTHSTRTEDLLDSSRSQQLNELTVREEFRSLNIHLSRFNLLLTVLTAFLYRNSGLNNIAISAPAANRSGTAFTNTLGLFVEVLPMVIRIEEQDTLLSLFGRIREQALEFIKHSYSGACNCTSNRKASAVLNYLPLSMCNLDGIPVSTQWLHPGHSDSHHLIRMHVTDWNQSGQVNISVDFNDNCFSPQLRESAKAQWRAIFDTLVKDINQPIDAIDILQYDKYTHHQYDALMCPAHMNHQSSNKEHQHNHTHTLVNITDRFRERVKLHPNDVAISNGKTEISYQTLHDSALQLSKTLIALDVKPGQTVAVLLDRSINVPIAFFGVLMSGAAYVPIDAQNPDNRIIQLIDSAQADIVITEESIIESFEIKKSKIWKSLPNRQSIILSDTGNVLGDHPVDADSKSFPVSIEPDETAYILYTSGSTGSPKGVMVSHAAMDNYCSWAASFYTNGDRLTFPLFTSIGFDLTLTSIFVPLISGGQIRVYENQHDAFDESLLQILDENLVDIIKLTPSHLSLLQGKDLSSSRVKQLIVGGEDLKTELANRIHSAYANQIKIHNEYGPTEATVGCIVHTYDPDTDRSGSVPIGKPVAATEVLVLNDAFQLQPIGLPGSLYLSGPSLAKGYWGRDDLTNERFLQHPFVDYPKLIYATGDRVKLDHNGKLVYLGRNDEQVKINGTRIELAEIEAAVSRHTAVTSCISVFIEGNTRYAHKNLTDHTTQVEYHCKRCGISSNYPEIKFDADEICSLCQNYTKYEGRARTWFKTMPELEQLVDDVKTESTGKYDCIVLLSGGKDSTYALARLADLGLSILAYTLDNGFISDSAKTNIAKVCATLHIDHEFGQTSAMQEIFADSLNRFSNVCNGCFKTIYTLALLRANELDIKCIFTGLSRGQFFETRLTEDILTNPDVSDENIDEMIMAARKSYHRTDDAVSRLIDTRLFNDDTLFEQINIIDFYRYCDVSLEQMMSWMKEQLPWVRPSDTGRSTNCLINDAGIYIHKLERGYHNYSLPYSWDVRLGHKDRDTALEELDDDIDEAQVNEMLEEVGYVSKTDSNSHGSQIALYFTSDTGLTADALKNHLTEVLPRWMLPHWFVPIDKFPLNTNGKIDKQQLPSVNHSVFHREQSEEKDEIEYIAPSTQFEITVAVLWCKHLRQDKIGIHDNFFRMGGDSLSAIRIASQLNEQGFSVTTVDIFENPTIKSLSQVESSCKPESKNLDTAKVNTKPEESAFALLKPGQMNKLSQIVRKN